MVSCQEKLLCLTCWLLNSCMKPLENSKNNWVRLEEAQKPSALQVRP